MEQYFAAVPKATILASERLLAAEFFGAMCMFAVVHVD